MEYLQFSGPVAVLASGLVLGNLEGLAKQFKWADDDKAPARIEKMELEFLGELVFLLKTLLQHRDDRFAHLSLRENAIAPRVFRMVVSRNTLI